MHISFLFAPVNNAPVITHRSCPDNWLAQFSLTNMHKGGLRQHSCFANIKGTLFVRSPVKYGYLQCFDYLCNDINNYFLH
jgi:hypothetical protein